MLTEKLAELLPAGTVMEAGVVATELLSVSDTPTPPEEAAADKATVHWLAEPPLTVLGEQVSEDRVIEVVGCSVMDADLVMPPWTALTWTAVRTLTLEAFPANVAVLAPAMTVTEEGTTRLGLSLVKPIVIPEVAEELRATVQVVEPAPVIVVGEQASEDSVIGATTVKVVFLDVPLAEAVS